MTTTKPVDHNIPLALHLNQSLDLPLPGGVVKPGSLSWGAESADPHIAAVTLAAEPHEASHSKLVVWHLKIKANKPGKTTIKVHESAATHPVTTRYSFTIEVAVLESEEVSGGVMLLTWENLLRINGELGWYSVENNASTGYRWVYVPDNSGVYELAEELTLHASLATPVEGASGSMTIRKWRGVKEGKGVISFHHIPPGSERPSEIVTIPIVVK